MPPRLPPVGSGRNHVKDLTRDGTGFLSTFVAPDGTFGLARFGASGGSRDMTFGNGGIMEWPHGAIHRIAPLKMPGGGYLLTGFDANKGSTNNDFQATKRFANGGTDTSWGIGGLLQFDGDQGSNDRPIDWALDSQGRLVPFGSAPNLTQRML